MYTVHPSIMIGSYTWDQDRLPRDEFQMRVDELHAEMDRHGWKAMIIHGDARQHSALAYYTNFIPRMRWGLALIPREGEPRLLVSMSSRDIPAMKLMTWIADVLSGWQWEAGFDSWMARLSADQPIDVGTVGFDFVQPRLLQSIERSLGDRVRLHDSAALARKERPLRPRELSMVRDASAAVNTAARAVVQSWRNGHGAEKALIDGERAARNLAVHDVRTLVSLDGGRTLVPFRGEFAAQAKPLVCYIAVKAMGYWAESFVTLDASPRMQTAAEAGLDALLSKAKPGATAAQLHTAASVSLGSASLHPVLGASVGRRIGLSLNEGGELRAESQRALTAGDVYALHFGLRDASEGAIVSAMVAITAKGVQVLANSSDVS
jgi:Xaa-Pro aminopeptidase